MSDAVYIPKAKVDETLAITPVKGKRNPEPFKSYAKEVGIPLGLLEDVEVTDNEAEVHMKEADLWLSIEGECTFVCGGELVNKWVKENKDGTQNHNELRGTSIAGGTTYTLKPGDWLFIPGGVPHVHNAAGVARLAIIKIPSRE